MELIFLELVFVGMVGLVLKVLLSKFRETELKLLLRRISIQEFEYIRQGLVGVGLLLFVLSFGILML